MCGYRALLGLDLRALGTNVGPNGATLGLLKWFWALRFDFLTMKVRFRFLRVCFWSLEGYFNVDISLFVLGSESKTFGHYRSKSRH